MKPPVITREEKPILNPTKNGIQLLCPFCNPPHALNAGEESECGTSIRVVASQTIYNSHGHKEKIRCLKCGGGDGQFVRYQNAFIHLHDCMPGTKVLAVMPEFSPFAKVVYGMPKNVKAIFEKRLGRASALDEIDKAGQKTGKILGYFFWKQGV